MKQHLVRTLACISAVATLGIATSGAWAASAPAGPSEELRLRAGILRGEDERDASDPILAEALASKSADVRARAVRALGRIGDESSVPRVSEALADRSRVVQREAVFALGEIESSSALPALEQALGSKDPEQRALAAEAITKIAAAHEDVREIAGEIVVRRELKAGAETEPDVVRRALLASWRLGGKTQDIVPVVTAAYLRKEPAVSAAAVYAAMRLSDARFAPVLELASKDPRPDVRADAARGFGRLARLPGDKADKSLEHRAILVRRGLDVDPGVRIAAFGALEPFPADERMAAEMLEPSLADEDHGVQRSALSLVRAWGIGCSASKLAQIVRADDLDLVPEAAGALAAVDAAKAMPELATLAKSKSWQRRAAAAEALGRKSLPQDATRPILDALLADDDARVVAVALDAAVASGRSDAPILTLAHLEAKDVVVRAVAAAALPDLVGDVLDEAEAVKALHRALVESALDATPDARLASLDALAKLDAEAARPSILEAMDDHDFTVRLHARGMLADSNVTPLPSAGVVGAGRTMDFYLDAARDEMDARTRLLRLETDRGVIDVALAPAQAVMTVRQMSALARGGFFDGLSFHRVVPSFVAQGGDPRGDGWGGPGGSLRCEINTLRYDRGAAGMALSGKDTGGSQFFFTLTPQPHLDGGYTIFGFVTEGSLPVVDRIRRFDVIRHASVVDAPAAGASHPKPPGRSRPARSRTRSHETAGATTKSTRE